MERGESSPSPAGQWFPWAAWVLSLPASCSPLLPGHTRLAGQRASFFLVNISASATQGDPAPRPDNSPGSPFRSLTPDSKPLDRVERPHRPQAEIGKGSLSLTLYQVPERGQQRQAVARRRRVVAPQAGSHQNRQRVGLPHLACGGVRRLGSHCSGGEAATGGALEVPAAGGSDRARSS